MSKEKKPNVPPFRKYPEMYKLYLEKLERDKKIEDAKKKAA